MYLRLLVAAGLSFGLDRVTKLLVSRGLAVGQSVAVTSWLTIRRVVPRRGWRCSANPGSSSWFWRPCLAASA